MKKRITKQTVKKVLADFKEALKQYKFPFDASTVNDVFSTQHNAIILPTKEIKSIPNSAHLNKVRFILKSGRTPKGYLSLAPSGDFSHFSFGKEAGVFSRTLNQFLKQKKLQSTGVHIIKEFHSGTYFFKVKQKKQPVQFFIPDGKSFVQTTAKEIIRHHNELVKQLAEAQKEFNEMS